MRILIIEDSKRLQFALRTGLQKAGHIVDVVGDGKQGWIYATRNDYDVVLLDLMIPEIDGLTLLRRLRQEGHGIHVLVLTAKGSVEERVDGLRAGADDYLSKPFEFDELLARIEALGRRKYGVKNPCFDIGDLRIDTTRRLVTWKGTEIPFTKREFALIHYLALRRGEVVTRVEIEDHLYNEITLPNSNAVDSAICLVRSRLKANGCDGLIETRRGAGYIISEAGS